MKTLLKYAKYIRPYFSYLIIAILLMWLMSILSLAIPYLTKLIIDNVIINQDTNLLVWIFVAMLVIKFIVGMLTVIRNYILAYIGNKIDLSLRFDFVDHITHLPFRFFDDKRLGEIQSRISDAGIIQVMISSLFLDIGTDSISLLVYLIFLYILNVPLAIAVTVIIPIYVLNTIFFVPYFKKRSQLSWEKGARINSEMYEILAGMRTIKTFALEKRFLRKFKYFVMDALKLGMELNLVGSFYNMLLDYSSALGLFVVYFVGAKQIMASHLTIGGLIAFVAIMPNIFSPLSRLVGLNQKIQEATKAAERFDSVWSMSEEKQGLSADKDISGEEIKGNIEFKNVFYAYNEQNYVLKDINLKINSGETIAIVGKSGSGKTTLTNLIPSFYSPQKGALYIDGKDIKDMDVKSLRKQIGIVQQEPFLFSGSIKTNITLGLPYYKMEEIEEAAKLANAYDFIKSYPDQFDTQVGEKGLKLSVGQKQRITIARVLLLNPRILILDEPTSALDLESEKLIRDAMEKVSSERTTIIIAHRLSTIRNADRIIVLDSGTIIESGTHDELLSKDGHYAGLYKLMGRI